MKQIERVAKPDCWTDEKLNGFYSNLRDSHGDIRPRWTNTCLDENGVSRIRLALHGMSNECCAYCGKKIQLNEMDVEHFLPKETFEYLAYCWENYLPSCKSCNQTLKHNFIPNSLKNRLLKDVEIDFLPDFETYNKEEILGNCNDRLIDPSFDEPSEHLEFNPINNSYSRTTEIGAFTFLTFFHNEDFANKINNISLAVKDLINGGHNDPYGFIQEHFIKSYGYEFYYSAYYEFWANFYD